MSSMTISVPLVPALGAAPFAAAMGAGAAGLGLAAAAYLAARQLKSNYDCALSEFETRAQQAEADRRSWVLASEGKMAKVEQLAAMVGGQAGPGATSLFVTAAIQEAVKLSSGSNMADLNAKAQDLVRRLQAGESFEDLGDDAIRIGNEIHKRLSREGGATTPQVEALLQSVRLEASQLVDTNERKEILRHVDKLVLLSGSEPKVALQGIQNIRDRIERLAKFQIRRESEREKRRVVAGEAAALLQALSQVQGGPEPASAIDLLARLGEMFSATEPPQIEELLALRSEAKALFDSCQARLDNEAKSALITDSVADTLMEMGYKVSHVPAEGSDGCLVSVSADTGMLVTVDSNGHLKTEMVAFEQGAVHPDGAMQDKVCKLVDQVLEGLRKRDIEVKEKSRKMTKSNEEIRSIERPDHSQAIRQETRPLEKVVD